MKSATYGQLCPWHLSPYRIWWVLLDGFTSPCILPKCGAGAYKSGFPPHEIAPPGYTRVSAFTAFHVLRLSTIFCRSFRRLASNVPQVTVSRPRAHSSQYRNGLHAFSSLEVGRSRPDMLAIRFLLYGFRRLATSTSRIWAYGIPVGIFTSS